MLANVYRGILKERMPLFRFERTKKFKGMQIFRLKPLVKKECMFRKTCIPLLRHSRPKIRSLRSHQKASFIVKGKTKRKFYRIHISCTYLSQMIYLAKDP